MKQNIDSKGRAVRTVIGLLVLAASVYYRNWWGGALGLFMAAEGILGWCAVKQFMRK
ncbi:MAG: hypothetical protein COV74_02080 [Candidatus Omnitrophica bacterium CG11_big_fil_rev_8_21_14_0_20_45_26]|uniref:Inner membrane protein YgaP-like transmembrane domain-containing protein n=1 Tax=Candidatus Abzuiibacterium crystallinum TaxID=1974748 RepID=A0A2H0LUC0_9BACT|nr:MAG: hypothetical protein COV74_02080 [Candidatus Omnitrophica bacterium CG11_big_fil_rev_8_21_14_0_20_45_26]PIW63306.1 MAG: DUF2892 domain-containing protein [Candidatus Omnitrophica bacterium CG12_big_fil_rev_8_21_14_0_65_45_16]